MPFNKEIEEEPWKLPAAKKAPKPDFNEPCAMMEEIQRKREKKPSSKLKKTPGPRRPSALDKMDSMMMVAETKRDTGKSNLHAGTFFNNELGAAANSYKAGGETFGWGPRSNYKPGGGGVSYMQQKRQSDTVAPLKPLNTSKHLSLTPGPRAQLDLSRMAPPSIEPSPTHGRDIIGMAATDRNSVMGVDKIER